MRLIDADALIEVYKKYLALLKEEGVTYVDISWEEEIMSDIETISKAPTVDAEPAVRCKDCKWFRVYKTAAWCANERGLVHLQYDSFCSCGERRKDASKTN